MDEPQDPGSPSKGARKETPKKSKKKSKKAKKSAPATPAADASSPGGTTSAAPSTRLATPYGSNVATPAALGYELGWGDELLSSPFTRPSPLPAQPRAPIMADRLTQLQDCLNQLATQMYASLHYVADHHAAAEIDGQLYHGLRGELYSKEKDNAAESQTAASQAGDTPGPTIESREMPKRPDSPETFAASLRELSRDLVLKEQQIEYLVSVLPVVGDTREAQENRIQELIKELEELDEEAKEAEKLKKDLINQVEDKILSCRRVW